MVSIVHMNSICLTQTFFYCLVLAKLLYAPRLPRPGEDFLGADGGEGELGMGDGEVNVGGVSGTFSSTESIGAGTIKIR